LHPFNENHCILSVHFVLKYHSEILFTSIFLSKQSFPENNGNIYNLYFSPYKWNIENNNK
jgi:hypothetical protein